MEKIEIHHRKYKGISLEALLFLAKTPVPVEIRRRREVFQELFQRYFLEGRKFNLYDHLEKETLYTAHALSYELKEIETNIPVEHVAQFMVCVLSFMEEIEKNVLEKKMEFEWQIHEMSGIRDMLEKIREAKITDMVLRQKINQFIDKINQQRKETLLFLEKKEQEKKEELEPQQLVVMTEKKALMKQVLEHLPISISKAKKEELKKMLREFNRFYPEDQIKILKTALKKYPDMIYADHSELCVRAFKENLTLKVPKVNMINLISVVEKRVDTRLGEIAGGTEKGFFEFMYDWYLQAEGATETGAQNILKYLAKNIVRNENYPFHDEEWNQDSQKTRRVYWKFLFEQITETTLALNEIENKNSVGELATQTLKYKSTQYGSILPRVQWDKEKEKWIAEEPFLVKKEKSVLLAMQETLREVENCKALEDETLPETIKQQIEWIRITLQKARIDHHFPNDTIPHEDKIALYTWIIEKKDQKNISNEEWKVIFGEKYNDVESVMNSRWGGKKISHFIFDELELAIGWHDFYKEEELKHFFEISFQPEAIYKTDNGTRLYDKLKKERPHEMNLLENYFSIEEKDHVDAEVGIEFRHLTPLEQLLLMDHGVDLKWKEIIRKGYKTKIQNQDVVLSKDEVKKFYAIQYFCKLYRNENKTYW